MKKPFDKILIANRGEIALRVIRACHEWDIRAVAVFSEPDRESLHVYAADEAYCVGKGPSNQSYLMMDRIIDTAKAAGCEAIHPGYGFLAENADFSQACEDAGIVFIGPGAEAMRTMGDKTKARKKVGQAGVPIIPGIERGLSNYEAMKKAAEDIGYPVLIKAALGGGGKGMRVCNDAKELKSGFELCHKEAKSAFGDPKLYLEKYLARPRHIEFQILADRSGKTVHLGERECSIQRRHQKLIEESPSVIVDDALREKMGSAAIAASRAVGYVNAGTIEFLMDEERNFYFLEMNTRLQVEHPVTELVTGIDLVHQQFNIAAGFDLEFDQDDIIHRGHAIECRVYAEDPESGFLPSCGRIERIREPAGPGIRLDSGVYQGFEIPVYYDPLISKLLGWAPDRLTLLRRMRRALGEYKITGVETTIGFLGKVLAHPRFQEGDFDTHFIDETELLDDDARDDEVRAAGIAAAIAFHHQLGARFRSRGQDPSVSPWKLAGRREAME